MTAPGGAAEAAPISLETVGLGIRFGGHKAVDAVSCAFRPGELTCIVGPNGAGKTTYFNLVSGQLRPSEGRILLRGRDVTAMAPSARALAGLGRAFQLTSLFPQLTVLENVRLVVQARQGFGLSLLSLWSAHRGAIAEAEEWLRRVALHHRRDSTPAALSHGDQRKLEVAMLIALDPDIFLFDEPTAGMSVDEMPVIIDLIRTIKEDRSKTVLLVEHKMDVVRSLADRIVVLHNGVLLADGPPAAVMDSPIVHEAYLGMSERDAQAIAEAAHV